MGKDAESNLDQELRLILSKAIAKYTPTRILREMNKEWWLDLIAAENAIKTLYNKEEKK